LCLLSERVGLALLWSYHTHCSMASYMV
jgi:hypothetical protein